MAYSQAYVVIEDVPDYDWFCGCFGTATGNLIAFWDRNGFPDMYTGPVGGGVAPLNSFAANREIYNLWASEGHRKDYYNPAPKISDVNMPSYESAAPDPWVGQWAEHEPDCIGDFIGLSQNKWTQMNGECDGNIDAYTFVYWDPAGDRRLNYTPPPTAGEPPIDMQSGLRAWSEHRGYQAAVFTQLTDFNPHTPPGKGFTFEDLKAEIDAGYPVLVFLQRYNQTYRPKPGMDQANPEIHGMLIYGYSTGTDATQWAIYRTSWASGDGVSSQWTDRIWKANMPVRGVIVYHPLPKVTQMHRQGGQITLEWDGPASIVTDQVSGSSRRPHWYVVEKSSTLNPSNFQPVIEATTNHSATIPDENADSTSFFRVLLEHR